VVLRIVKERVADAGLEALLNKSFKAGYVVEGLVNPVKDDRLMQGSPLSPFLSNVVIDKLDKFIETKKEEYHIGSGAMINNA
jgi:RNA-directed DNA polymerase